VNDTVSQAFERAQELREHCSSLRSGVVKQHDTAMRGLKPLEYELKLLTGRLRVPVARPKVGPEHHNPALLKIIEQRGCRSEARKAEEGCPWRLGRLTVKCGIDAGKSPVDLSDGSGERHAVKRRMRIGVGGDRMPLGELATGEVLMRDCVASQEKERGSHAFGLERIENARSGARPRTVVKSQDDFSRGERQGLREGLTADPWSRRRIDSKDALCAEHVRSALTTRLGVRRSCRQSKEEKKRDSPDQYGLHWRQHGWNEIRG